MISSYSKCLSGGEDMTRKHVWIRLCVTAGIALMGGVLFSFIHIPIPWLLGPMTAVFIGSRQNKLPLYWPRQIRDIGLILVGYSIGLSFTKKAIAEIMHQLPSICLMTITLVLLCSGFAFAVSKITKIDYATILTGSIPGGLSQMISLAEEIKGIDITVVTFMQIIRVIVILFSIPFLIFSPLFGAEVRAVIPHQGLVHGATVQEVIIFAAIAVFCAVAGGKLKLPTAYLTGPAIGIAILSVAGFPGPSLSPLLLDVSQILIGCYVGLLVKPEKLQHKVTMLILAIVSSAAIVFCAWGLSLLLLHVYHVSAATSFLSVAPGGMDQMGIIAHEIQADVSMVTSYQLFRLFFIYFAVPPLLRWFFRYRERRKEESLSLKKKSC